MSDLDDGNARMSPLAFRHGSDVTDLERFR